jgi:hypothetical protein
MNRLHRPSPSLALAVIALVAALAGTAVAGAPVTAAKKKPAKPLTAKTGTQLFNSLLAKAAPNLTVKNAQHATNADNAVNAANATHAANATNAGTVGGLQVKKLAFVAPNGTPATKLFEAAGIKIEASCANYQNGPDITLTATSSTVGGVVVFHGGLVGTGNPGAEINVYAESFKSTSTAISIDQGEDRAVVSFSWLRADGQTANGVIGWDDGVTGSLCGVSGALTAS